MSVSSLFSFFPTSLANRLEGPCIVIGDSDTQGSEHLSFNGLFRARYVYLLFWREMNAALVLSVPMFRIHSSNYVLRRIIVPIVVFLIWQHQEDWSGTVLLIYLKVGLGVSYLEGFSLHPSSDLGLGRVGDQKHGRKPQKRALVLHEAAWISNWFREHGSHFA